MRRELLISAALAASLLSPSASRAQDASVAGDAGSSMSTPAHGETQKQEKGDQATEHDPHGDPHGGDPHGGSGMFEPPEDVATPDPSVPQGTVTVTVVDEQGRKVPRAEVTLGIVYNSVAKGESRKRVTATADESGTAKFEKLEVGRGVAYRPMVLKDGATFSLAPFQLTESSGIRALLHVYPVTSDIESTLVVAQTIIYTEVKDDRVQIQEAYKIYNFGKNAWVPNDAVIALPSSFTAFTGQQGMTDIGVDAVPNKGVKLRGTFPPGQHLVEFRWQLPYSGESEVRFDVGLPPHVAAARVIAPASRDMKLQVPNFPEPQSANDGMGQRVLLTEKQLKREDKALRSVEVVIRGLPTSGPGRWIATLLAAGGLALGFVVAAKKPAPRDRKAERERLLDELADLERAHATGDVGPKTYERARRELLDEIARTLSADKLEAKPERGSRRKSRAA